jgi:2-keto-4-pentenoate hydratase/2-oxohepta-3-ene-1,7-dioic acid hydratase in catechol pathway
MRIVRYGAKGAEKPALLDAGNVLRALDGHVADITPDLLTRAGLARIAAIDASSLPAVPGNPRLGVPVKNVGKFIAIGLNYADHAREAGLEPPTEPVFFTKAVSCLNGPNDNVVLPKGAVKGDWEVELGVVIGTRCRYVAQQDALSHVAGYVLVNDVSERAFQKEMGSQWDKGKGCDSFGPVGPWIATRDEIPDPQKLEMWLDLNGKRMQSGNTRTMIFGVAELIAYVSRFLTLEPGDILTTGTPPGVGEGQKPNKIFLKPGDVMTLGIERLGEQRQTVHAFDPALLD